MTEEEKSLPKKGSQYMERKQYQERLHVQDAHTRLNFLHQAAVFVSMQGSSENDGFAKLSRQMTKNFREVLNTERVKIDPNILRTFCKKCKQVFIAKNRRFELKLTQKKVLTRTCLHCGFKQNYEMNRNYLSRNEKHMEKI